MVELDEVSSCAQCGMPVCIGDYHPFAACLMFRGCGEADTVTDNLDALVSRWTDQGELKANIESGRMALQDDWQRLGYLIGD